MAKRFNEKRAKAEEFAINKELDDGYGKEDFGANAAADVRAAAMGKGDEELFERKMTKEEKKAAAKAAREAKKKAKEGKKGGGGGADAEAEINIPKMPKANGSSDENNNNNNNDLDENDALLQQLADMNIAVTYESKKGKLHANTRDINVGGVTVTFHGKPLIEETEVVINYGNRYGFIGPNGSGKSTIMKAIAARAIPIPESLDIYFLDCEYPARDDITALEAVMESNDEIARLEAKAEALNHAMAEDTNDEEAQAEIQNALEGIYGRLDQLDAATAESRATSILFGLGFTPTMQNMKTKEFSGGWRMRVALARALFIQPEFLLYVDDCVLFCVLFCVVNLAYMYIHIYMHGIGIER